jgi:hypothetical protein
MAMPSLSDNALALMHRAKDPASPEEIFLAWLLRLPDDVNAYDAAAIEVVCLDSARLRSARRRRLRQLFVEAAQCRAATARLS